MITYAHPTVGKIVMVPTDRLSSAADWRAEATVGGVSRTIGYVVDIRADDGGEPSEVMPENEDSVVFDAFADVSAGHFIGTYHSPRSALLAIGNRFAKDHYSGISRCAGR